MSDDSARIEISASSSQLDAGLRDAASKIARWSLGVSSVIARGMKVATPVLTGAAHRVGAGAVDFAADQARDVMDLESNLVRFGIAGDLSRGQIDGLREAIRNTSKDTGVASSDVLNAAQAYVGLTGDVAGAQVAMSQFARISKATGSDAKEVATAAQAIRDNFKIDPADFEKAFSVLASQGKAGAVELRDFAGELSSIAPSFAQFKNLSGVEGLGELGAALQVVRKGFGSASEAANGLRAMMTGITQHSKDFEKAGVRIFDKDPKTGEKTMRSFSKIWHDINNSKLVKDPTLLQKAFGTDEGKRAYQQLRQNAGLYDELITAGGKLNTIAQDYATYSESGAGRMEKSMNMLKERLAEVFTPELIDTFVTALERGVGGVVSMFEKIDEFRDWITDRDKITENPYASQSVDINQGNLLEVGVADTFFGGGEQAAAGLINNNSALKARAAIAGPYGQSARDQLANEASYNKSMDAITGLKAKSDRIRAAIAAGIGGENQGAKDAGDRYLQRETKAGRVSKEDIDRARTEVTDGGQVVKAIDLLRGELVSTVKAIANRPIVFDTDKVDSALGKSQNPRRER